MMRLLSTIVALWCLGTAVVAAQPPATPAPVPAPAQVDNLPSPPADFAYDAAGRRDPFLTLARGVDPTTEASTATRPQGAAGLLVDELTVRGIVLTSGTYVAMVSGPGARQSYSVREGSRLFDGTVKSITPRAVVILQQVSDPLSLQKQREVRKLLRSQEEGK